MERSAFPATAEHRLTTSIRADSKQSVANRD
jgi:hypothetical protein